MSPHWPKSGEVKQNFCSLRSQNLSPTFKTVAPPLRWSNRKSRNTKCHSCKLELQSVYCALVNRRDLSDSSSTNNAGCCSQSSQSYCWRQSIRVDAIPELCGWLWTYCFKHPQRTSVKLSADHFAQYFRVKSTASADPPVLVTRQNDAAIKFFQVGRSPRSSNY